MIKLFRFLKPYRITVIFVLILTFLQVLSNLYLPTLMSDIVDVGIVNGDISYIIKIGAFMLLIAALGVGVSVAASYYTAKSAMGFGKILRDHVFTHVEKFSLQGFDKIGTASLITRTTEDITQLQQVLTILMRIMIMAPMMAVGGVMMAVSKDAKLSLVIIAALPVLAVAIWLIMRKGIPLFKVLQKKLDRLNLVQREGLTGVRVIRSFNRIDYEKKRFDQANLSYADTSVKANRIMAVLMPVMMLAMNFSMIAIVWFGGIRIEHGDLQVGDLMAFLQYAMQILMALVMGSMMFMMIPRAQVSAGRVNEVLETVPDIEDPRERQRADEKSGYVEFRHVTFSYPGAEKPAIEDISFCANPGEVTAIIGGTGAGKSTMINLIPRFYDVDSGSVRIDGVDVRDMTQDTLRSKIGYIPQKAVLFTGTVADNIRYGKEDATDEEVRKAAMTAQADEFIQEMDDKYDSMMTQGGSNVSGGQKQRLSIARALVKKPEIYLFDDSFSALDYKTDARLRSALKQETGDATVLIVAQRASTVMDADRIIVLEEGRVAGMGKHSELMKTCEVYREIVSSQLSEEETA